ncbi:unnamed protein product [Nezara viridula]|uniref:Centrosome-associated FAM110 C-terminal domain-containing protein n=1 Tax=Nezara viridula TaxID=85310 RepID=A0A9P0EA25_NEZVI|nr:unnamed protein product [Nezara viridula]
MTSMFHPLQTFRHYTINDYRHINANRKSAVEVLEETKPLYVKSLAALKIHSPEEKRSDDIFCTNRTSTNKKQERSCDLESKLRRLLDSKDSLGEDFCYKTEVQYKSLPDLSTSSHESFGSTIQHISCSGEDQSSKADTSSTIDTDCSSSEKSYGKPPSLSKSCTSMGGSAGKVESKIWKNEKLVSKVELIRSKSDPGETQKQNELPPKLDDFFQFLGLSSQSFRNLTAASSNGSNPVFFPSESSADSSPKGRGSEVEQDTGVDTGLSIVERNARVIKWLVACAKS